MGDVSTAARDFRQLEDPAVNLEVRNMGHLSLFRPDGEGAGLSNVDISPVGEREHDTDRRRSATLGDP
jgi:hypothetical protein